jgi:hypothetical protein
VWAKANPNYGVSVFPDDLERLCLKARQMTSAQANFRTKRLSVWVNADQALFDMEAWGRCADRSLREEDFHDECCWIGVDLAPRHDFCSLVKLFRRGEDYNCFAKHYLSDDEIEESSNAQFRGGAPRDDHHESRQYCVYGHNEDELREAGKTFQIREVPTTPIPPTSSAPDAGGLPDGLLAPR